jgi:glycine/D-amino acid oxidase-like deaminating enzyme
MASEGLPTAARFVVIGGGVHGLSAAWHLAKELHARGEKPDVIVIEKSVIGAGASGISGGIVRNYYRSEAMTEVIAESVGIFESDREGFGFHQVGYLAVVPEAQREDLEAIAERQREVGFESELASGDSACAEYLEWLWPDVNSDGVSAVLHEKRSGWADAIGTVRNLARLAREAGVQIFEGVEVTGLEYSGTEVDAVITSDGTIRCEAVVGATGLWTPDWWRMQGLDPVVTVGERDSGEQVPLVEYWLAQEGDFVLPGVGLAGNAGRAAPVVHFDHTEPLYSDRDGELITDQPWGIYFRMGKTGSGIVGGGLPLKMGPDFSVDPYGPDNAEQLAGDDLSEFFTSGLAFVLKRFRGAGDKWDSNPNGGVLALTADRYPVTDWTAPNVYSIVDAGHGFKMLAVGREAAREILGHRPSPMLEPFRLARFGAGNTHVVSKSPYPWT